MMTLAEARLTFKEDTHTYIDDKGNILISVTTLLSKYGVGPDYSKLRSLPGGEEMLEKAAKKGTAVHKTIETYDNTGTISDDAYELDCINELSTYINIMATKSMSVTRSEYRVHNDILAGSIDKVLGDGSLADIKTCSSMSREDADKYRWQLSFYSYLFRQMNPGTRVPHLYIIWLRGTEGKVIEIPPIPDRELERIMEWERNHYDPADFFLGDTAPERRDLEMLEKMKAYVAIQKQIAELKERVKVLDAKAEETGLLQHMLESHTAFGEFEGYRITLVEPGERTSIDSKALQVSYPDIWSEVSRTTPVKASLRITKCRKNN